MVVEVSVLPPVSPSPDVPKMIGIPGFVVPAPPAEKVVPVTAEVVGFGVISAVSTACVVSQECPVVLATLAMLTILVPIFRIPDVSRRTGVPAIVTPGPPAEIVVPAIGNAIQLGVKTWPPTLYAASCKSSSRIAVLLILTRLVPIFRIPELSNWIAVPAIVTPRPPAEIVVPSIENPAGCGLNTWSPIVKVRGRALSAVPVVSPRSEPATVVPGLPDLTVWLIKSAEALFAVNARDDLMVGHASGLKQPALVTVTAVDTVRSLPGIATTGPAFGMSPAPSVITGRGIRVFPIIVRAEGKRVSPITVGAEGKRVSPRIVGAPVGFGTSCPREFVIEAGMTDPAAAVSSERTLPTVFITPGMISVITVLDATAVFEITFPFESVATGMTGAVAVGDGLEIRLPTTVSTPATGLLTAVVAAPPMLLAMVLTPPATLPMAVLRSPPTSLASVLTRGTTTPLDSMVELGATFGPKAFVKAV